MEDIEILSSFFKPYIPNKMGKLDKKSASSKTTNILSKGSSKSTPKKAPPKKKQLESSSDESESESDSDSSESESSSDEEPKKKSKSKGKIVKEKKSKTKARAPETDEDDESEDEIVVATVKEKKSKSKGVAEVVAPISTEAIFAHAMLKLAESLQNLANEVARGHEINLQAITNMMAIVSRGDIGKGAQNMDSGEFLRRDEDVKEDDDEEGVDDEVAQQMATFIQSPTQSGRK